MNLPCAPLDLVPHEREPDDVDAEPIDRVEPLREVPGPIEDVVVVLDAALHGGGGVRLAGEGGEEEGDEQQALHRPGSLLIPSDRPHRARPLVVGCLEELNHLGMRAAVLLGALGIVAALLPGSALTQSTIPIFGQSAFCGGLPIEPVNGVYLAQTGCVVNLQISWPAGLVNAKPQASPDGGATWVDFTDSVFPPVAPGLVSGLGVQPCDRPGPGRWLFRARGLDSAGADVYTDPFPHPVSACEPGHFQGYEVGDENPDFHGEDVLLSDRFGVETAYGGDARMLLAPAQTRRASSPPAAVRRPDEHLKCYRLTGGKRLDAAVRFSNEFTAGSTLLVKEPTRLCTPATTGPDGSLGPPRDRQHSKCYRVEETPRQPEEAVELTDEFGARRAVVRRAELLCTPVTLEGQPAPRPTENLVCYGITELAGFAPRRLFTHDGFGLQSVLVFDPLVVCVPSTI